MGLPVQLHGADLDKPFVYDRAYGLFYVPMGSHQHAMSILLAFQYGLCKGIEVAVHLGLKFSSATADHWLESTPGAAFRSSVGRSVQAGKPGNLTVIERRLFGAVDYLF